MTNMPIGQICIFLPINIEITIIVVTMIVTDIILPHLLEICIIQVTCNEMQ